MDLLRNLGSAAVSSIVQKSGLNLPFSLGEKNTYFEGRTIWSLYDATKRDDGSQVSVFVFDSNQPPRRNMLPLAKNALRKLRTVRHPDVLKFIDTVDSESVVYIMTERVKPLGQSLGASSIQDAKMKAEWNVWGIQRITTALAFVNGPCDSTHGNVKIDSIFLASSGEWRLGGFDLLSNAKDDQAVLYHLGGTLPDANRYASPEVKKGGWSTLKEHHPTVADAYALGLLIHSVFNLNAPLPATVDPPHPPPGPSTRGAIPNNLFGPYKRLLNPNPKTRLSTSSFLDSGMMQSGEGSGFFVNNTFVKICEGLSEFNLSSDGEKSTLLKSLKDVAPTLPPDFAAHRVLPTLVSALEFGGATANAILPIVLQLGAHASPADYPTVVLAPIAKLFTSADRGTRMALLDHLPEYADKLDNKTVVDKIWPNLQTGFTDTVGAIREATVKSVGLLYPKLNDRILNNDLLRHLARMQRDPESSIRTNTCILIGRMALSLGYNTKKKVLVAAFAQALKDPFVHARVAGLMSFMATVDCFDIDDLASKVIPSISPSLIDKEKLVRDQAFKAMALFVKKLESHAEQMPETALDSDGQPLQSHINIPGVGGQNALVNSAAGAAGALAGWAMGSLTSTKKLAPSDLQSSMTGTSQSISAPSLQPSLAPSLSPTPSSSALSSPGVLAGPSSASKSRGMQLGGTKKAKAVDSWGDGDLMDINADEGDWTAFESAPLASQSTLGFADVGTPSVAISDEADAWGALDDSTNGPIVDSWGGDLFTPQPIHAEKVKERAALASSLPKKHNMTPKSNSVPLSLSPATNRSLSPGFSSPVATPPMSPIPSSTTPSAGAAVMTKEEKAAHMAKMKEERRLRIEKLKAQKKQAVS